MRYYWEVCPTNPNYAQMHVDRRVPGIRAGDREFGFSDKVIPAEHQEFVDRILAIPGVESLSMRDHQIGVIKGTVFRWDEITSDVEVFALAKFDPEGELTSVRPGADYRPAGTFSGVERAEADDDE